MIEVIIKIPKKKKKILFYLKILLKLNPILNISDNRNYQYH